jgi:hypothetical protein
MRISTARLLLRYARSLALFIAPELATETTNPTRKDCPMTTTVKVHVNGRYRATVTQIDSDGRRRDPVVVDGNYGGSPNPSGEKSFYLPHPAAATFEVSEEYVPEQSAEKAA